METNFSKIYLDLNILLAKTLVIKSDVSIDTLNERIRLIYGTEFVNTYDPHSWKYYLNISGEYHFTDTVMTVTSLDTLEEIIFSKQNLLLHTATKRAYEYGSRYYYSLVSRYPDQEQLILGILYPCDIHKAVESSNGSILTYPSHLVEPQEITLIPELEDYIRRYILRWDVKSFAISDELYPVAQHAIMYLNILPKLLNLRLERCKTYEAHSFHIKEYLASHYKLDRYIPYLTLKQLMFLYRNLRYIQRNSGRLEQFKTLLDRLLTDRYIPLNELSIRQLSSVNDAYYPDLTVRRKALNEKINIPEKDYFELDILRDKEYNIVYGNPIYLDNNYSDIAKAFQNHSSSVIQTKDLESSMIDYNDSFIDPIETVLLRQWAYMSNAGLYDTVIVFKDPQTLETKSLSAKDAFIYMYYLTLMSVGIQITEIPNYINLKFRLQPLPTLEDLLSVVDHSFDDLPGIAQELLNNQPSMAYCYSIDSFFNLSYRVYEEAIRHWYLISSIEDYYERGLVANMVNMLYGDQYILLESDTDMATWLYIKNLSEYDYTLSEAQSLIRELYVKSTGFDIDETRLLKNIQKSMISIFKELSSYSIQFITEINNSNIKLLNWAAIRIGNQQFRHVADYYVENDIRVIDTQGSLSDLATVESDLTKYYDFIDLKSTSNVSIDSYSDIVYDCDDLSHIYVDVKAHSLEIIADNYHLELTDQQRQQIKSIY